MSRIRRAAQAGRFYPANAVDLAAEVDRFMPASPAPNGALPKMLVVPHAGYVYSGGTAGAAYSLLQGRGEQLRRVVLIGPNHRVPLQGVALPRVDSFATPLGQVPVDTAALAQLAAVPGTEWNDAAHDGEHCLEVQLPFLQRALGEFRLVPLVVGACSPALVASLLELLWGGDETLIVVSTDLSHYLPQSEAEQVDARSAELIESGRPELQPGQACGAHALNGALLAARRHGLGIERLALCTSGDTAGSRDHVVGYGAWALRPAADGAGGLDAEGRGEARRLALHSLQRAVHRQPPPAAAARHPALLRPGACFVTLHRRGRLRGCIGSLEPRRSLAEDIIANAAASALRDPRFDPVEPGELGDIELELSLLGAPEPLAAHSRETLLAGLRPGRDGLILQEGQRRATYLPSVWEQLPAPEDFLHSLLLKGGWRGGHWSGQMQAWRYSVLKC